MGARFSRVRLMYAAGDFLGATRKERGANIGGAMALYGPYKVCHDNWQCVFLLHKSALCAEHCMSRLKLKSCMSRAHNH